MVDSSLPSLVIDIKVLQVVVEIDRSGTEVPPQEGSVGGKDGRHVDMTFSTERDGQTGLPFVEVADNGRGPVTGSELMSHKKERLLAATFLSQHGSHPPQAVSAHLAQEPSDQVSKDDRLVGLVIIRRSRDPGQIPKIGLPLVQPVVSRSGVKEDDLGGSLDQPSTVDELDTSVPHGLEREGERRSSRTLGKMHGGNCQPKPRNLARDFSRGAPAYQLLIYSRFNVLHLHRRRLVAQRPDQRVPTPILGDGDGSLGLDDGVDTSDLVGYLPGDFEQERVVYRTRSRGGGHGA